MQGPRNHGEETESKTEEEARGIKNKSRNRKSLQNTQINQTAQERELFLNKIQTMAEKPEELTY